jgi:hypothetical protein
MACKHCLDTGIVSGRATGYCRCKIGKAMMKADYEPEEQLWTEIKEGCKMPETNDNVLVWNNGHLGVMSYGYIEADENSGYAWSNCYGDVDGDPQFDDEYSPTHWMKLPKPPNPLFTKAKIKTGLYDS